MIVGSGSVWDVPARGGSRQRPRQVQEQVSPVDAELLDGGPHRVPHADVVDGSGASDGLDPSTGGGDGPLRHDRSSDPARGCRTWLASGAAACGLGEQRREPLDVATGSRMFASSSRQGKAMAPRPTNSAATPLSFVTGRLSGGQQCGVGA